MFRVHRSESFKPVLWKTLIYKQYVNLVLRCPAFKQHMRKRGGAIYISECDPPFLMTDFLDSTNTPEWPESGGIEICLLFIQPLFLLTLNHVEILLT